MNNLSLSKVKKMVYKNLDILKSGKHSLESIFEIIFNDPKQDYLEYYEHDILNKYTYGEVKERILKCVSYLNKLNIKEKYIGLCLNNSPEWIIFFWAILASNHIPVLMNTMADISILESIVSKLNINLVISDLRFSIKNIDLKTANYYFYDEAVDCYFEDKICLATCGTTGEPKLCLFDGESIYNHLLHTYDIIPNNIDLQSLYKGCHKELAMLPFYHIFGFEVILIWFSFFHQILVFSSSLNADALKSAIIESKATSFISIPMVWETTKRRLMNEVNKKGEKIISKFNKGINLSLKLQNKNPSLGKKVARGCIFKTVRKQIFGDSLTYAISGGAYISSETLKIFNGLGYRLVNGYGMTEIGITSFEQSQFTDEILLGSIGKPFSGIEYKIDEQKELLVKGKSLCCAIFKDGKFVPLNKEEYFHTGDIAEFIDGRYYLKGRKDDIIVSKNGELYSPEFIESKFILNRCDSFAIIDFDNTLCMVISFKNKHVLSNVYETMNSISKTNDSLPLIYKIKKVYMTDKNLPKVMKEIIQRKVLKEDMIKNPKDYELVDLKKYLRPIDEIIHEQYPSISKEIKEIVSSVMGIDESSIKEDSHFLYDLNMDSISYFSIVSKVSDKYGVDVTTSSGAIFACIKDICNYILKE